MDICRQVDSEIVAILRERFEECVLYEKPDHLRKCADVLATLEDASTNWFIKCKWHNYCRGFFYYCNYMFSDGDLGANHDAKTALMKQKHRLIWERRHGPVGSGKKDSISSD